MDNIQNNQDPISGGINPPTPPVPPVTSTSPVPLSPSIPVETMTTISHPLPTPLLSTTTTPPVNTVPTSPQIVSEATSPVFVSPPSVMAPVSTPMGIPATPTPSITQPPTQTTVTTVSVEPGTVDQPVAEEVIMPTKNKMPPAAIGIIAVIFVGIAGAGTFAVSRAISGQQAIAPTAPVSEPAAFEPIEDTTPPSGPAVPDDSIDCSLVPNTAAYKEQCLPVAADEAGNLFWIPQTGN